MGVFAPPPPGPQPPQAEAPLPATVQRPSAKVAQVQLPDEDHLAEGAQGGAESREATAEERAQAEAAESFAAREPGNREEPSKEQQRTRGDGNECSEPADVQAAKRTRLETFQEDAARFLDGRAQPQSLTSAVSHQAQEPSSLTPGDGLRRAEFGARQDEPVSPGLQSSSLLMGSQLSNCSSSSSGSRCGDVWTPGFQSALELPENDPTIRPPAA